MLFSMTGNENIHLYNAFSCQNDEPGINPLIKVWDTSRNDKNGTPFCHRITRAIPGNKPVNASTICVHETLQLLAIGFEDGSLLLYRGEITRERGSKRKLLRDASTRITGIAFKATAVNVYLFVATENSVFVYIVTYKDKEQKVRNKVERRRK